MPRFLRTAFLVIAASFALLAAPAHAAGDTAQAGFCRKVVNAKAGATAAISAGIASAKLIASSAGIAAVHHASGGMILSSVGAGGTGYLAGTLGTVGAAALGFVSTPAVIVASAMVAGGAGVTVGYCIFRR